MKVTQMEVKTFYTIEIEFPDFTKAMDKVREGGANPYHAFSSYRLEDTSIGYLCDCYKSFLRNKDPLDIMYIVIMLGFEGIDDVKEGEHPRDTVVLHVYNNGDCLEQTLNG